MIINEQVLQLSCILMYLRMNYDHKMEIAFSDSIYLITNNLLIIGKWKNQKVKF